MNDEEFGAAPSTSKKSQRMDKKFFGPGQGMAHVNKPFNYQYSEQGKELSGRKLKQMTALNMDVDPTDVRLNSKKHFKANKRRAKKVRSEYE
ncbi:hypothetical protein OPT61_g10513 [Boeremia exigua]|uniref:Uncharacterized protein n=1 Tax=Boeremia exigua TaxID=749465 RepID=A0ACC2HP71_9PLEO|nr:hypothetical protein OPT61_g10513 [Boeremia exigua]